MNLPNKTSTTINKGKSIRLGNLDKIIAANTVVLHKSLKSCTIIKNLHFRSNSTSAALEIEIKIGKSIKAKKHKILFIERTWS
jgi:hypothetical protein